MCFHQPKGEYIRFHVIANSDSPEDQQLKLRVRDRLLERFGPELSDIHSIDQGRRIIGEKLSAIREVALEEIKSSGRTYPVQVMFGRFPFPTRVYGDLVLPAGEYEALKVIIGQGKGANWWCVMFPPLCFIDISHGIAHKAQSGQQAEEVAQDLQQGELQAEQYMEWLDYEADHGARIADEESQRRERVEYRWKVLEWWEESREKVESLLSFLNASGDGR
jgi:stage II sporulation protein R